MALEQQFGQPVHIYLPKIPLQEYSGSFISEQNQIVNKILELLSSDFEQFKNYCNGYHDHLLDKLNRKLVMNSQLNSLLKIASICHDQFIQNEFAIFKHKNAREISSLDSFKSSIAEFVHSASLIRLKELIEEGINKSDALSSRTVLQDEMRSN